MQKAFEKQKWNFSGSALFDMKTRVRLKYFMNGCWYLIWTADWGGEHGGLFELEILEILARAFFLKKTTAECSP